MKSSHPSATEVLDDLGDKVAKGLALMVAQTRDDLRVYRRTFPLRVADSTDRGLLNWCHDRAWTHAMRIFAGYRWDPELREVGAAVISLRDGADHLVCTHPRDRDGVRRRAQPARRGN